MLFRCSCIVTIFIFLSLASRAQLWLGFEAGINSNKLKSNTEVSSAIHDQLGYYYGFSAQLPINHWLSVEATPNWVQKGYKTNQSDSLQGVYTAYKNTFLQLPLIAHVSTGRRLKLFIDAGFYAGYWLSSHISGRIPDIFSVQTTANQQIQSFNLVSYSENHSFDKHSDNRTELGYVAGLGLEYIFLKGVKFFLAGRYYYSVSDLQKHNSVNEPYKYNQTITLAGGLKISINSHLK